MDKTSTPCTTKQGRKGGTGARMDESQATLPKITTIDFLKQFARAYHAIPGAGCGLPGIILS